MKLIDYWNIWTFHIFFENMDVISEQELVDVYNENVDIENDSILNTCFLWAILEQFKARSIDFSGAFNKKGELFRCCVIFRMNKLIKLSMLNTNELKALIYEYNKTYNTILSNKPISIIEFNDEKMCLGFEYMHSRFYGTPNILIKKMLLNQGRSAQLKGVEQL